MNAEFALRLDEIPNLLDRRISMYEKLKRQLDDLSQKIKNVNRQEDEFQQSLREAESFHNALKLFLEGIELKKLQSIDQKLKSLEHDYRGKISSLNEKIKTQEFDAKMLTAYYNNLLQFLSRKKSIAQDINSQQREVFENVKHEIEDAFNVLDRLLNTLTRKVEKLKNRYDLKEYLNEEQNKAQQIQNKMPLEFETIVKLNEKTIKGLYNKIKKEISLHRKKIRQFAVKNKLLSKDEITILEAIYETKSEESEFNDAITTLKGKTLIDEEEIQSLLLGLSRKGFIVLRIYAD